MVSDVANVSKALLVSALLLSLAVFAIELAVVLTQSSWQLIIYDDDPTATTSSFSTGLWQACVEEKTYNLVTSEFNDHTTCYDIDDFNHAYVAKRRSDAANKSSSSRFKLDWPNGQDSNIKVFVKDTKVVQTPVIINQGIGAASGIAVNAIDTLIAIAMTTTTTATTVTTIMTTSSKPDNFSVSENATTRASPPTTSQLMPMPTYDSCQAPVSLAIGSYVYSTQSNFGFPQLRYLCAPGYSIIGGPSTTYLEDVFCSENNATAWTTPPSCRPSNDACYIDDGDVCSVGNQRLVLAAASSNKIAAPPDVHLAPVFPSTALYIFPSLRFECSGVVRQWDIVGIGADNSTSDYKLYIDVWRPISTGPTGQLQLVGSNAVQVGIGLQGTSVDVSARILVQAGDIVGIHYDDSVGTNNTLIYFNQVSVKPSSRSDLTHRQIDRSIERDIGGVVFTLPYVNDANLINLVNLSQLVKLTNEHDPSSSFVPAIVGYVTIVVMAPSRLSVVQALGILAIIAAAAAVVAVIVMLSFAIRLIEAAPPTSTVSDGFSLRFSELAVMLAFSRVDAATNVAIVALIFSAACVANCLAYYFDEFVCTASQHVTSTTIESSIYWFAIASGFAGIVIPIFLCVANKRCLVALDAYRKEAKLQLKQVEANQLRARNSPLPPKTKDGDGDDDDDDDDD